MLGPFSDLQGKEQSPFLSTASSKITESQKTLVWKAP